MALTDLTGFFNDPVKTAQELMQAYLGDERVARTDHGWSKENGLVVTENRHIQEPDAQAARSMVDANRYMRDAWQDPFYHFKQITGDAGIDDRVTELAPELKRDPSTGKSYVQPKGAFKGMFVDAVTNTLRSRNTQAVEWLDHIVEAIETKKLNEVIPDLADFRGGLHSNLGGLLTHSLLQAGQDSIYAAVDRIDTTVPSAQLIQKVHGAKDAKVRLSVGQTRMEGSGANKRMTMKFEAGTAILDAVFERAGIDANKWSYDRRDASQLITEYQVDNSKAPGSYSTGPESRYDVSGAHRINLIANDQGMHFAASGLLSERLGYFRANRTYKFANQSIDLSFTITRHDVAAGAMRQEAYDRLLAESKYMVESIGATEEQKVALSKKYGIGYAAPVVAVDGPWSSAYPRVRPGDGPSYEWRHAPKYIKDAEAGYNEVLRKITTMAEKGSAMGARLTIANDLISTHSGTWQRMSRAIEAFTRAGGEVVLLVDEIKFGSQYDDRIKQGSDRFQLNDASTYRLLDTRGNPQQWELLRMQALDRAAVEAQPHIAAIADPVARAAAVNAELAALQRHQGYRGWAERAYETGNFRLASTHGRDITTKTYLLEHQGGEFDVWVGGGTLAKHGEKDWNPLKGRFEFKPYVAEAMMWLSSHEFTPLKAQALDWLKEFGLDRYFRKPGEGVGLNTQLGYAPPAGQPSAFQGSLASVLYHHQGLGGGGITKTVAGHLGGLQLRHLSLQEFDNQYLGSRHAVREKLRYTEIGFNVVVNGPTGEPLLKLRTAVQDGRIYFTDHNRYAAQGVVFQRAALDPEISRLLRDRLGRTPTDDEVYAAMAKAGKLPDGRYTGFRKVDAESMVAASLAALDEYYDHAIQRAIEPEVYRQLKRDVGGWGPTREQLNQGVQRYLATSQGRTRMQQALREYYDLLISNFETPRSGRPLYPKSIQSQALFFEEGGTRIEGGEVVHGVRNPWTFMNAPAEFMTAKHAPFHGQLAWYQRTQDYFGRTKVYDPVTGNLSYNMPKGYLESLFRDLDILTIDEANADGQKYMFWIPVSKMFQQTQRLKSGMSATIFEIEGGKIGRGQKRYTSKSGERVDAYRLNVMFKLGGMMADTAMVNPMAIKDTLLSQEFKREIKVSKDAGGLLIRDGMRFGAETRRIKIFETNTIAGKNVYSDVGAYIDNPLAGFQDLGEYFVVDQVAELPMEEGADVKRYEIKGRTVFRPSGGMKLSGIKATTGIGGEAWFQDLWDTLQDVWNPHQKELARLAGFSSAGDVHVVAGTGSIKTADVLLDFGAELLNQKAMPDLLKNRSDANLIRDFKALNIKGILELDKVNAGDPKAVNNYDPAFRHEVVEMINLARSAGPLNEAQVAAELRRRVTHMTNTAARTTGARAFRSATFMAMHLYMRNFVDEQRLGKFHKGTYHSGLDRGIAKSYVSTLTADQAGRLHESGWLGTNWEHLTAEELAAERQTAEFLLNNAVYLPMNVTGGFVVSQKPTSTVTSVNFMRYYGLFHDKELFDSFVDDPGTTKLRQSMVRAFTALNYGMAARKGLTETFVLPGFAPHMALMAEPGMVQEFAKAGMAHAQAWADLAAAVTGTTSGQAFEGQANRVINRLGKTFSKVGDAINAKRMDARKAADRMAVGATDMRVASDDFLEADRAAKLGAIHFVIPLFQFRDNGRGYLARITDLGVLSLPDAETLAELFPHQGPEINNVIKQIGTLARFYAERQFQLSKMLEGTRGADGRWTYRDEDISEHDWTELRKFEGIALQLQQTLLDLGGTDNIKVLTGGYKLKGRAQAPVSVEGIDPGTIVVGGERIGEFYAQTAKVVERAAQDRAQAKADAENALRRPKLEAELARIAAGRKAKTLSDSQANAARKAARAQFGDVKAADFYQQEYYAGFGMGQAAEQLLNLARKTLPQDLQDLAKKHGLKRAPAGMDLLGALDAKLADKTRQAVADRQRLLHQREVALGRAQRITAQDYLGQVRHGMTGGTNRPLEPGFGWWLNVDVDPSVGSRSPVDPTRPAAFERWLGELGLEFHHRTADGRYRIQVGSRVAADEVTRLIESSPFASHLKAPTTPWHADGLSFGAKITGHFHVGGVAPAPHAGGPRLIFDFETTGTTIGVDAITQAAWLRTWGGQVTGSGSTYANPRQRIPWEVTKMTGITDAMVAHAPSQTWVATRLMRAGIGATLVAYNAPFDVPVLNHALGAQGQTVFNPVFDPLTLARTIYPTSEVYNASPVAQGLSPTGFSQTEVGDFFNLPNYGAHDARWDVAQLASLDMHLREANWRRQQMVARQFGFGTGVAGPEPFPGLQKGDVLRGMMDGPYAEWVPQGWDPRFRGAHGTHTGATFSNGTPLLHTSGDVADAHAVLSQEYGVHWNQVPGWNTQVRGFDGTERPFYQLFDEYTRRMTNLEGAQATAKQQSAALHTTFINASAALQAHVAAGGVLSRSSLDALLKPFAPLLGQDLTRLMVDRTLLDAQKGTAGAALAQDRADMAAMVNQIADDAANRFRHGVSKNDHLDRWLREHRKATALEQAQLALEGKGTMEQRAKGALDAIIKHLILPSAEFSTSLSLRAGSPIGGTNQVVAAIMLSTQEYRQYLMKGKGVAEKDILIGDDPKAIYESALAMMTNQGDWDGDLKSWTIMEALARAQSDLLATGEKKYLDKFAKLNDEVQRNQRGRIYVEFAATWAGAQDLLPQYDQLTADQDKLLADYEAGNINSVQLDEGLAPLQAKLDDLFGHSTQLVQQTAGLFKGLAGHAVPLFAQLQTASQQVGGMRNLFSGNVSAFDRAQVLEHAADALHHEQGTTMQREFETLAETLGTPVTQSEEMLKFISDYVAFSSSEVIGKAFNDTYGIHHTLAMMSGHEGYGVRQENLDLISSLFTRGLNQLPRDLIKPKTGRKDMVQMVTEMMGQKKFQVEGKASGAKAAFYSSPGIRAMGLMHAFLTGMTTDMFGDDIRGIERYEILSSRDTVRNGTVGAMGKLKHDAHRVLQNIAADLSNYLLQSVETAVSGKVSLAHALATERGLFQSLDLQLQIGGKPVYLSDAFSEDAAKAKEVVDALKQAFEPWKEGGDRVRAEESFRAHLSDQLYERLTRAFSVVGDEYAADPEAYRQKMRGLDANRLYDHAAGRGLELFLEAREQTIATQDWVRQLQRYGFSNNVHFENRLMAFNQISARSGQIETPALFQAMLHDIAFGGSETVDQRLNLAGAMDRSGTTKIMLEEIYKATGIDTSDGSAGRMLKPEVKGRWESIGKMLGDMPGLALDWAVHSHEAMAELTGNADLQKDPELLRKKMADLHAAVRNQFNDIVGITNVRRDSVFNMAKRAVDEVAARIEGTPWKARSMNVAMNMMGGVAAVLYEQGPGNFDAVATAAGYGVMMGGRLPMGMMMRSPSPMPGGAMTFAAGIGASMVAEMAYNAVQGRKMMTAGSRLGQQVVSLVAGVVAGAVMSSILHHKPIAEQLQEAGDALGSILEAVGAPMLGDRDESDEAGLEMYDEDGDAIEFLEGDDFVDEVLEAA